MRKTYLLIEKDGERALVRSLNGHEGWRVVKDSVPEPPSDHCHLCPEGNWVEDADAKERDRLRRMGPDELIEEVLRRIGRQ